MKIEELTVGHLHELFRYDLQTGLFTRLVRTANNTQVGDVLSHVCSDGYVKFRVYRQTYQAHRLAWLYVHGSWPTKTIDHIDGNRANNQIVNLRDVTHSENMQNQRRARSDSGSGLLGAFPNGVGWMARIKAADKNQYLGTFKTPELAHAAYLRAKRVVHTTCSI